MESFDIAYKVRQSVLNMTHTGKSSHVGSALSCIDILSVLYSNEINLDKLKNNTDDRDLFIMSKGHAGAALYAVLAHCGIIKEEVLLSHYQNGSSLSGHVSHKSLKGIEISTGSLGHGLPVAIGMAYGLKLKKSSARVYCLMSDGELDEGSNWEAFLFGAHNKLNNLVAIIDRNMLQSIKGTEETLALEPLIEKLIAFGWDVDQIDGHDHQALKACFSKAKDTVRPTIIIASTTKGKGVSFMENKVLWHYRSPNSSELQQAIDEVIS